MPRNPVTTWYALTAILLLPACFAADVPAPTTQAVSRAAILADAHLPELVAAPVPAHAIALPDDWPDDPVGVVVHLSEQPSGELSVRRVANNDGRLYLEIYSPEHPLSGTAQINIGQQKIPETSLNGSLWLSLKPRIGHLAITVFPPNAKEPVHLIAPTTLIEIRDRRIFVNGEPFLLKGAMSPNLTDRQADYVRSLGINTLRGLGVVADCEKYGFMNIASLNLGEFSSAKAMNGPDAEFDSIIARSLEWLKENSGAPIASPNTLILQLGNEKTGPGTDPPHEPLMPARRHVNQLLAAAVNCVKPLSPMLPVGYANQDLGFLAPDCMDLYMHNSFLDKDRYGYAWDDFMKWQGCLPPDGKSGEGRPFVNSEFGANRYLCQAYREGPNNPFLEKLHAWNFPNRWAEFMEHGTAGGCIYRLDDLEKPVDQGCSCFGITTHDGKPKLACWEVRHMWRDFEVEVRGTQLVISFKRDYWARDCRLTLTNVAGKSTTVRLDDFAPRTSRTIDINSLPNADRENGFRWDLAFSSHSGLPNRAVGACPDTLEQSDFLDSLKGRDTYPFLKELFDAQVLRANGQPAPRTLTEMTDDDGMIPVALRKANRVTYLLLITREKPDNAGPLRSGVNIDVAFEGKVERVDDMTGEPLGDAVEAVPLNAGGQQLRNMQAARIPGPIGQRSTSPFKLPVYRITPRTP